MLPSYICSVDGLVYLSVIRDVIHFVVIVMLQPSEVTKNDSTSHKMMVQFFFPPAGEIRLDDVVSRELD